MLNSLKRELEDLNIKLPDLQNVSFKMLKSTQMSSNIRRQFIPNALGLQANKFLTTKPNSFLKHSGERNNSIMHVGRWILSPYQAKAVDFFFRAGKRILLAHDWNMGKTVTSLACMHYSRSNKILIVVPKILVGHWTWHVRQIINENTLTKVKVLQNKTSSK